MLITYMRYAVHEKRIIRLPAPCPDMETSLHKHGRTEESVDIIRSTQPTKTMLHLEKVIAIYRNAIILETIIRSRGIWLGANRK